ncbi:exonuclease sbcCD subunit D [Bifidobacterium margollesii]|uniref:Nuclease SbcCD subunit D n=1 Tax=Bifidobacterium margollesii TaxID=2020964 RepID=A0A2N5JCH5_9BIFI|nr:exonuclease subunit SbcD [Bifidobacterium margollesii]PLS31912.1 exonuclease sbcCD subunit D [Bifidobacterium margollesii]
MKILHTSDWHIGRRFKGLDLADYQRRALDWLVGLVKRERVDVVCVSGDVYDSPTPSASSVDLLDDVLTRLTGITDDDGRPAVDVIITPGNHDSATKLGFGAHMMCPNLHLRCEIGDIASPVIVRRRRRIEGRAETLSVETLSVETLAVYALPYLDPDVARPTLARMLDEFEGNTAASNDVVSADGRTVSADGVVSSDGRTAGDAVSSDGVAVSIPRSHEGVMTAAMRLIGDDLRRRRSEDSRLTAMLMAHAFVTGASPTDSERTIAVGGVDGVPAGVFAGSGLDYLALGHLHRPQWVTVPDDGDRRAVTLARYSGSLLAYSFSEGCRPPVVGNGKSVVLVETDEEGRIAPDRVRVIPVESGEPALVRLRGSMAELTGPMADNHRRDWVSLAVTEPEYPHGMYRRLDECYESALEKGFESTRRANDRAGNDAGAADAADGGASMAGLRRNHTELDVVKAFVVHTLGRDPDAAELDVLQTAIERVHRENGD